MTADAKDPDPALLLVREHVRNLDARVVKADRKSREEVLLYGEHLLELRAAVGSNDTAFSKELSSLGLQADKNVRSDAQKLAHAVASGTVSRDNALLLPAREIRALPSPLKRRVSHVRNPKSKDQEQPDRFEATAINQERTEGTSDEFAISKDGAQVVKQNLEDPGGDDVSVEGAGVDITPCLIPQALIAAIRKEVQSGKKSRVQLEAAVNKDTSGASRRMLLLMDVLVALGD